jgi:elongation factor P
MIIVLDGEYFAIVGFLHVKPGKGQAFVRTKLKNVKTGAVLDKTFKVGERIKDLELEKKKAQYLYTNGDLFFFMDKETFDQLSVAEQMVRETRPFLKENLEVDILTIEDEIVGVEIPFFVVLRVVETDPGVRGDTVSATNKPAKLETGATVRVPLFIETGDSVRVDTRTGQYVERA